jgi:hypothetical protein
MSPSQLVRHVNRMLVLDQAEGGVSQEFDHFPTTGRFSGCRFRLNGIFDRELSRSLVDKWLLVTTQKASAPPNPTPIYLTVGRAQCRIRYLD